MNVVPGWWCLITLLEVQVPLEAGPMVAGAVSIAARSVYQDKQAALLLSAVFQEPQILIGKVVCRA